MSDNLVWSARDHADFWIALSTKTVHVLLKWLTIKRRLCAVWLDSSMSINNNRMESKCLFVLFTYGLVDSTSPEVKNQSQPKLIQSVRLTDTMVAAGDFNISVGCLGEAIGHIIRSTGHKEQGESEMVKESRGLLIHFQKYRPGLWAEKCSGFISTKIHQTIQPKQYRQTPVSTEVDPVDYTKVQGLSVSSSVQW